MKITLKLFASLTEYCRNKRATPMWTELDVAPDASILRSLSPGLPLKLVHLVLINGKYVEPEKRMTQTLVEGDVLAIWPPIAGG